VEVDVAVERTPEEMEALTLELVAARDEFLDALGDVEPALLTAPGLVGEWSGRELIGHMALWTEHAVQALAHAASGRLPEFGEEAMDVDETNAVQAQKDAGSDLAALREREQRAFARLLDGLRRAEPAWLEERAAYGDTLGHILRDDGSDHYREHAGDLRAWFGPGAAGEDEDEDE
jgi:hypothetical protein